MILILSSVGTEHRSLCGPNINLATSLSVLLPFAQFWLANDSESDARSLENIYSSHDTVSESFVSKISRKVQKKTFFLARKMFWAKILFEGSLFVCLSVSQGGHLTFVHKQRRFWRFGVPMIVICFEK